jgi:predicted PurR-regulated permease PerM
VVTIAHRYRFGIRFLFVLDTPQARLRNAHYRKFLLRRDHMSNSSQKASPRLVDLSERSDWPFVRKLLLIVGIAASALALWRLSDVVLLAFGSILLALVLRGLAGIISDRTKISEGLAVAVVVIAMTSALAAFGWLFGSQIATQFELLSEDLPQGFSQIVRDLRTTPWGAWIFLRAQEVNLTSATTQVTGYVTAVFGSIVRTAGYLAVLLFASIYLAAQPDRYLQGLLRLVPQKRRERVGEVFGLAGRTLQRWLVGQSTTMALVGSLTGLGLWGLGVPAPLALGLLAGLFAFIPYVGPILSSVPGILMAATHGPLPAFYAALLYAGVHFVEGNLITPIIQAEVVELPPILTLFATLVFGLLLGPIGVLLAAPLAVVILVIVNTFYLEDALGEDRSWPAT